MVPLTWKKLFFLLTITVDHCRAFTVISSADTCWELHASGQGFGSGRQNKAKKRRVKQPRIDDSSRIRSTKHPPNQQQVVDSEQQDIVESFTEAAAKTLLGRTVAEAGQVSDSVDPFWTLIPSLISSRFPALHDDNLGRVAGFLRHTLNPSLALEDGIVNDRWRPHKEIHAYMPGLGPTQPFHDPSSLDLCRKLSENYDVICSEYMALLNDMQLCGTDRFQSVTSMNYDSGWQTLVLFYNGHRIENFPYHLCPTTTSILESVPLAGRIAGFNVQQPQTGIPLHSDGNNMWLTCQMGIKVPDNESAYIRVGPETRSWTPGECLVYDTTYEHETMNKHESQERVVLHVDFFNTLSMTVVEIEILQYIYRLREEFLKAEGVSKVGAQLL